jgi:drug/metabolite transporter (DMT)-like permease
MTAPSSARSPAARRLIWPALASIYLIWGSTYLGMRVMVETIPPLVGAGFRFLIAGAGIYCALRARRGAQAVRFTRPNLWSAAAAGALLCMGGNGLVTVAEQRVPAGLAATLYAAVPLWIILFRRLSGDSIHRLTLLGVLMGFVGVAGVMLPGARPTNVPVSSLLLVVAAPACWACGSYYSRGWALPPDLLLSTALQMLTGGLAMLLLGVVDGEFRELNVAAISLRSVTGFAWLVTAGTVFGYTTYGWLLRNAPISRVATYAYVNPIVAIVLGWALLHEQVSVKVALGGGLIIAAVALVVSRETQRDAPLQEARELRSSDVGSS